MKSLTSFALLMVGASLQNRALASSESSEPKIDAEVPKGEGSTLLSLARSLSAKQALHLALEGNPDLKAALAQSKQAQWGVVSEDHRYQFVWGADANYTESHTPRLQTDNSISSNLTRTWTAGTDISRRFSFGTEVEFRLQEQYFQNSFSGGFNNPTLNQSNGFGSTASLRLTQPLLRGAGNRVGDYELRVAQSNYRQATKSEEKATSELVRDVLVAYSELWYATQSLEIEISSQRFVERQLHEAEQKVQTGSLAQADLLTFSTQLAEQSEKIVSAENDVRTRSIELQRLIGRSDQESPLIVEQALEHLGSPSEARLNSVTDEDSFELAELREALHAARLKSEIAGEDLRPRLDVEASAQTTGLGTDAATALRRAGEFQWVTGQVSLTFEAPVGTARKRAQSAEAQAAVRVAEENLRSARNRISSELRKAQSELSSAQQNLELIGKSRSIAEEALKAEQQRFMLGSGLSLQVQQATDSARRARLREVRAQADLLNQEVELLHIAGELLARAEANSLL